MIYKIQDRQSLVDVAAISGATENMFDIALSNELAVDETLQPGEKIELSSATLLIEPATGLERESYLAGIDYMGIEIDFIIS